MILTKDEKDLIISHRQRIEKKNKQESKQQSCNLCCDRLSTPVEGN